MNELYESKPLICKSKNQINGNIGHTIFQTNFFRRRKREEMGGEGKGKEGKGGKISLKY